MPEDSLSIEKYLLSTCLVYASLIKPFWTYDQRSQRHALHATSEKAVLTGLTFGKLDFAGKIKHKTFSSSRLLQGWIYVLDLPLGLHCQKLQALS